MNVILPLLCALGLAAAASATAQPAGDVIAEIHVHGNHTTPDAEVLALAGLARGGPASEAALDQARDRLVASGRFAGIEVRRRFASIEDPAQIAVVLMVSEHTAVSSDDLTPGLGRRIRAAGMWLPVLAYEDGYGFTYGARAGVVDFAGAGTRLSAPITWGGERRAAVELERTFDRGPLSRVAGTAGVRRRVNPFDDIADTRLVAGVRVERALTPWLRLGAGARRERVSFEGGHHAMTASGADAVVDTRIDPSFPRNAVLASIGVERLGFEGGHAATRTTIDTRGYLGLLGASVLAVGVRSTLAASPLPRYERALLGGASTLRGTRAGLASGDNLAALSAELRLPITSPLSAGRFGVKAFVDAGTAWDAGQALRGRRFTRGAGGGVFFGLSALTVHVDVGRSSGRTRWHAGLGTTF